MKHMMSRIGVITFRPPDQWDKPQPNPIEMMKAQAADKQAQAAHLCSGHGSEGSGG